MESASEKERPAAGGAADLEQVVREVLRQQSGRPLTRTASTRKMTALGSDIAKDAARAMATQSTGVHVHNQTIHVGGLLAGESKVDLDGKDKRRRPQQENTNKSWDKERQI